MRNYSEITAPIRGIGPDNKIWHDHMNDWFRTQSNLCEAWNTNQGRVYGRLKRKLSVEDTLTLPPNHTPTAMACVDPLGRHFNSKNEMYAAWGIDKNEFWRRVNVKKMTPEQALMYERPKYIDYEGKVFKSKKAMCEAHGTTTGRYDYRIKHGATLEYALEPKCIVPESNLKLQKETKYGLFVDPNGDTFTTRAQMCHKWGVSVPDYLSNLDKGFTMLESLTPSPKDPERKYKDHTGQCFVSKTEMCEHWGVTLSVYINRLHKGYSQERALTEKDVRFCECEDHLGNKYKTKSEMCAAYGIKISTYNMRIKYGMSVEEALTHKRNAHRAAKLAA